MARGDVVADIIAVGTVSAGASEWPVIRPASGVEWVIKCIAGSNTNDLWLDSFDGSIYTGIVDCGQLAVRCGLVTIPVTNDHYLRIRNGSGTTSYVVGYSGYITKE